MRRALLAVLILGMTLVLALPAEAIHKGQVCKDFHGPDGAGVQQEATLCLVVDDHDFEDEIRAMLVVYNEGWQSLTLHASYVKLIKGTTDVRTTGAFTQTLEKGARAYATTWYVHPIGTFHSRARVWICWPELPGDPCGSIVAWNSGNVTYP